MALTIENVRQFAIDWYRALDVHVPLADALEFLLDDGLEMRFPETTARGHDGFTDWYKAVTNRFFDEKHVVTKVDGPITGGEAQVTVLVRWEARIWNPPAAGSQYLGFDSDQSWVVVEDADSKLKIKTYIVNALVPLPGSASL